jgi:hypothetical protein
MQDGAFQEREITHPIGKSIFIFAGGTSSTLEKFGVSEPSRPTEEELSKLDFDARRNRVEQYEKDLKSYHDFRLLKGPDFLSRLHGFLNVLGPNPCKEGNCDDITWPIRRAIILRGVLGCGPRDELQIDHGLLNALLGVRCYRHGARSFEKILLALAHDRPGGRLHRSALPPPLLLARETDAGDFQRLLTQGDAFKNHPDLEALAAAIHYRFLDSAKKKKIEAQMRNEPQLAWTIHPAVRQPYDDLSADFKAANRTAAQRIPDHLALIGFVVEPQQSQDDRSWQAPLRDAIEKHLERLAQAEHIGWCAERAAAGWTFNEIRDNDLKHHPLLVAWKDTSPTNQDKDRESVRGIPEVLDIAKFKAVPVATR